MIKHLLKTAIGLRRFRESVPWTQRELAEVLGYKTYHTVCQFECGHRKIPERVWILISLLILNDSQG